MYVDVLAWIDRLKPASRLDGPKRDDFEFEMFGCILRTQGFVRGWQKCINYRKHCLSVLNF